MADDMVVRLVAPQHSHDEFVPLIAWTWACAHGALKGQMETRKSLGFGHTPEIQAAKRVGTWAQIQDKVRAYGAACLPCRNTRRNIVSEDEFSGSNRPQRHRAHEREHFPQQPRDDRTCCLCASARHGEIMATTTQGGLVAKASVRPRRPAHVPHLHHHFCHLPPVGLCQGPTIAIVGKELDGPRRLL